MATSDGAAAAVIPVGDGRATFSALPSPFGPWEEKGGGERKGAGDQREQGKSKDEREGGGDRHRAGGGREAALSLLMAMAWGVKDSPFVSLVPCGPPAFRRASTAASTQWESSKHSSSLIPFLPLISHINSTLA